MSNSGLIEGSVTTSWGIGVIPLGGVKADVTIEMVFNSQDEAYEWLERVKAAQKGVV